MRLTRQCFNISRSITNAFSHEEVNATYADMQEMGIAHLPYPDIDIIMPLNIPFRLVGNESGEEIRDFEEGKSRLRYTNNEADDWYIDLGKGWSSLTNIYENGSFRRRFESGRIEEIGP